MSIDRRYDFDIDKQGQIHFRDYPARGTGQNQMTARNYFKLQAVHVISHGALCCMTFYIPASEACNCWQLQDVISGGLEKGLSNVEQRCLSTSLKPLHLF